jgi:hypothetical protein
VLVLLLAIYAGASAGAVAGRLPWEAVGEVAGVGVGGLVGGLAWAAWLFSGRRPSPEAEAPAESRPTP